MICVPARMLIVSTVLTLAPSVLALGQLNAVKWCCTGHGIAQVDFNTILAAGEKFLALPEDDKTKWPFNPDTYLGHRGSKELETVTGTVHVHAL